MRGPRHGFHVHGDVFRDVWEFPDISPILGIVAVVAVITGLLECLRKVAGVCHTVVTDATIVRVREEVLKGVSYLADIQNVVSG